MLQVYIGSNTLEFRVKSLLVGFRKKQSSLLLGYKTEVESFEIRIYLPTVESLRVQSFVAS